MILDCFERLSYDLLLFSIRQDICSKILPAFSDSLDFLMLHNQLVSPLLPQVLNEVNHNWSHVGGRIVQLEPEGDSSGLILFLYCAEVMSLLGIYLLLAPDLSEQFEVSIKSRELDELSEAVLLEFSPQPLFIVFPLIV